MLNQAGIVSEIVDIFGWVYVERILARLKRKFKGFAGKISLNTTWFDSKSQKANKKYISVKAYHFGLAK